MKMDLPKILSNKYFVVLWSSQILTQLTINILNFVLIVKIFERTGSAIATSMLWISYTLPAIIAGPIASVLVDILDKKTLLRLSAFFQFLIIFAYSFVFHKSSYLSYFVAAGYSLMNQFYIPSEASMLPYLVDVKNLSLANGLFFITQQASLILGFGSASLFLKILGFRYLLQISSILVLTAFLITSFLPAKTKSLKKFEFKKAVKKFLDLIFEGYMFIKNEKFVLGPFVILLVMQITMVIILVNAPLIATEVLRLPLRESGFWLVLPVSSGAVLASLIVPRLLKRGLRKIRIVKLSLLSLIFFFLFSVFFHFEKYFTLNKIITFIILPIIGASFLGVVIPTQTFLQEKTPVNFRGRIFGSFWFITTILTVFPVLTSGTITEIFGVRILLFLLSILLGLVFIFMNRRLSVFGFKQDLQKI